MRWAHLGAAFGVAAVTAQQNIEPCATVSKLYADYAERPTVDGFIVDAPTAEACLRSVPLVKENATTLLDSIEAFWAFQSTTSWLKNPPPAYPVTGVDLLGGLSIIRAGINNGSINGEYAFQLAVQDLVWRAGDGHFKFSWDLLNVFSFDQPKSAVAISEDGKSLPISYYLYGDLTASRAANASISSIETINGRSAADHLNSLTEYTAYADPDARWNQVLRSISRVESSKYHGLFADGPLRATGLYRGATTNLTYTNGTREDYLNRALSVQNFTGINNGKDFYDKFCNPVVPSQEECIERILSTPSDPANATTPPPRPDYPVSKFMDKAGTIAGYFLDGSYRDTAVLSMFSFAEGKGAEEARKTLSSFLDACQQSGKTRLIIDLSSNGGGDVYLTFDFFKQLFPTLAPYNAQYMRANDGLNTLGSVATNLSAPVKQQTPYNASAVQAAGGYSVFDADGFTSVDGKSLTWPGLFGPQQFAGDNYTYLFSRKYYDTNVTTSQGSVVVTGYGNRTSQRAQPFKSENIVMVSDGNCDSACTIFAHWMKWQGKVKQVAIGGRPQEGPMSLTGGTRGSVVQTLASLFVYTTELLAQVSDDIAELAMQTELGSIFDHGCYMQSRTDVPLDPNAIAVNFYNSVAEGDDSLTPLQFTYEAADCRLFWTADMVTDISSVWTSVADVWRGNFSGCVAGSTRQPSSLSGNPQLYNNGNPANVSSDQFPKNRPSPSGSSPGNSSQPGSPIGGPTPGFGNPPGPGAGAPTQPTGASPFLGVPFAGMITVTMVWLVLALVL